MNINPRKYYIRSKILKNNNLENDENIRLDMTTHKMKNYEFVKSIKKIKNNSLFIFDPASVLCNKFNCSSFQNNKLLYRDKSHISKKNSFIFYDKLFNFLEIK